jgi:hypothetical protein
MMKKFIFLTICAALCLFFASDVSALTISPPVFELTVDPGNIFRESIRIFNETDKEVTLYTSTSDFTARKDKEGMPEFLAPGETQGDLADWIQIEKGPIVILPFEERRIHFLVDVPASADPGGHYSAIFFNTSPPSTESEASTIGIGGKLGSLLLVRVSGDIIEQGRLEEFKLRDNKKIYQRLPIDFVVGFENSGNVHLKPQGKISIKNILGKISGEVEINKVKVGSSGNVLPQTTRHFDGFWIKSPIEKEPENFLESLKAEKDNFAIGRYSADLTLDYGTEGKKARASIVFWVFPWRIMLIAGLALVLLLLAIKKYNKWIIRKAKEQN